MHTASYLHWYPSLFRLGSSLQKVHPRICTYSPTPPWAFTWRWAGKKSELVALKEEALHAFKVLREVCITTPVLAFADYEKPFLLETDASKEGLGAVLLQKQADGYHKLLGDNDQVLTAQEQNYHSSKLESLALKWVLTEHFKEYLPWKTIHCMNQQQSAHIHHDSAKCRCYKALLGSVTHAVHLHYQIPEGTRQSHGKCLE